MQRELPFGMLWCREARYSVFVQRGCYQSSHRGDELMLHLDGFYTKEFLVNGKPEKYEVQRGFNILTNEHWETCPEKPFILTGTVGQRWIVSKEELEEKYDIRAEQVWIEPRKIQVKPPTGKPFYVALRIPDNKEFFIYPKSVFDAPCGFDSDKAVFGNMENSLVPHDDGDYLIARHIDGKPEYAENYQKNNTSEEAAKLYDPQIINARVFKSTFDFSRSKEEIINKEAEYLSRTPGHGLKWCIPAEYEAYLEYGVRYTKPRDGEGLFIEKECEINGELKTVYFEKGFNFYFNRWWETSFDEPYIVDDANGERWPISKEKLLKEFEIDENDFPSDGSLITSKSPSAAQWYVAYNVPSGQRVTVVPFEAYREDGTADADLVMRDTSPGSPWFHADGEYIVAKHFDDKPDYVEIPENERTKEIAELYRPRLVNPNEMEARFYMAETKEEILHMCSESEPFDTFYANYGWE